jgi:prolycopene isomerase
VFKQTDGYTPAVVAELAFSNTPSRSSYDVVVVGSGLGGLAAGALLARAGQDVLVVERNEGPGGYARCFRRGDYVFDPAMHCTPQGGPGGLYQSVLGHCGANSCTFLELEQAWEIAFPDLRLVVPVGMDPAIEAHAELFPGEADGIRRFIETCFQLHEDIHAMPTGLGLKDLDEAAKRFPTLFKYMRASLQDLLDEHVSDPDAKAALAATWPRVGVPPSRASAFAFAQIMANYLEGSYYPQGGFQSFSDSLASSVTGCHGEIVCENGVAKIAVEDGKAVGVVLEGGESVSAPVVISNVDAQLTFERLIGTDHLPGGFMKRLGRMTPSYSAFVAYVTTSLDLHESVTASEVFLGDGDPEADDRIRAGHPAGMWLAVPTLHDPSLAPPGHHTITITSMADRDALDWTRDSGRFLDEMLALAEETIPGLRAESEVVETASPVTFERYSGNAGGSMYGWENTPRQTGAKRPAVKTPIDGLYLCGHWTLPGSGGLRVFASGVVVSQVILAERGLAGGVPNFAEANMPEVK